MIGIKEEERIWPTKIWIYETFFPWDFYIIFDGYRKIYNTPQYESKYMKKK